LPLGVLLGVSGTSLLASNGTGDKVGGGVLIAGAVPLIVYSIVNLTSSTDYKPLEIPGAPPR
jgi:hypothetical protein